MIEIIYKLWSEEAPRTRALTPDEYFETLDEDDEFYDEESRAERFSQDVDYLDQPAGSVEWTRKVVPFGDEHEPNTIFTRFSRDGRVMFWQRRNRDGHQEMCIVSQIDADRSHLARFWLDENGDWFPGYVGMIRDLPDGSQSEDRIFLTPPDSPAGDA